MATQTETYKLHKPARTDRVNIEDLNRNFDIIEDELKKRPLNSDMATAVFFDLDITSWTAVDFAKEDGEAFYLTDYLNGSELLERINTGCALRVKFKGVDNTPHTVILNAVHRYTVDEGERTTCSGTASNIYYDAYSNYSLNIIDNEDEYTIWFSAYPFLTGEGSVKTVNGAEPDENGNVEVPTAEGAVKFVNGIAPDETGNAQLLSTTGLAIDWANGTYTETLSDGTSRTEDIEFNANGMPTKFGSMAFSITGV